MSLFFRLFSVASWSLIILLSVYFFLTDVIAYFFGYRSPTFGDTLFHNQLWVVCHMAGGTLTLFLGPFGFWKFFRDRYLHLHRLMGKLYMLGMCFAGISALRLSLISSCVPCRVSLFLLAAFALISTYFAWRSVKARDLDTHRKFMIRSYVCVLAFVAVRVDGIFSLEFLFGTVEDQTMARVINEYFFSFVPLIVTEIILTWIPSFRKATKRTATAMR